MSTEQDAATPAAAVLERRQRRTTPQKRKQVCSDSDSEESETGSDGEWSGDDDPLSDHGREDEDEDEPVLRGRVRRHAITQAVTGPELDDGRHKSLAEKGWARRAVVVRGVGPCGGADLEELPGREEYGFKSQRRRDSTALRRPPFERRACASCRPQGGAAGGGARARP